MKSVAKSTLEEKRTVQVAAEQRLIEMPGDPDEDLELREEIKTRLRHSLEAEHHGVRGIPAQEVAAQLGLEWFSVFSAHQCPQ